MLIRLAVAAGCSKFVDLSKEAPQVMIAVVQFESIHDSGKTFVVVLLLKETL